MSYNDHGSGDHDVCFTTGPIGMLKQANHPKLCSIPTLRNFHGSESNRQVVKQFDVPYERRDST
jgi:hypothetical protein